MNIFLTDSNPMLCAQALDDLRLNKMILETGQMLCAAYRHWHKHMGLPATFEGMYKETHKNHPCNVWLRKSYDNYLWSYNHFCHLCYEKHWRTGKQHLTYTKLVNNVMPTVNTESYLANAIVFDFDCSNIPNKLTFSIFERYKLCLINKWTNDKRPPTWSRRGLPGWVMRTNATGKWVYDFNPFKPNEVL